MLKLLLCSAFIAPCFIIPFIASSAELGFADYETTSFEEAFVEPEFEQLENCQTAEFDVFFQENEIIAHSAKYITEGLKLSKKCVDATYVITPIAPDTAEQNTGIVTTQTHDLVDILEAQGLKAKIADPDIQADFNSLYENGRTATLKIIFKDGDSA